MHYAHTLPRHPPERWEPLQRHLEWVAEGNGELTGAASFAASFGATDLGRLVGLWHDLGKYSSEFQRYIGTPLGAEASSETVEAVGRVDHSSAGARHAMAAFPGPVGRLLAYCIAGHHAGLPDGGPPDNRGSLAARMDPARRIPDWSAAPPDLLRKPAPAIPRLSPAPGPRGAAFTLSVFCRMLFSSLVDADFLATEAFMSRARLEDRQARLPAIETLLAALNKHLDKFPRGGGISSVNGARADVLKQCRKKAAEAPGLFSLTVPTGGGKTLSSLAFALTHAARNNHRRVIYAIPFTSIIEQNADVFREALVAAGGNALVEHHSNFDGGDSEDPANPDRDIGWHRLASENWDAPLIVTTNVQLFESLFACRTSACRKLHNIARSVIVLDECQSLPVELLTPTLAMLDELRRNYGCTIVFCSATQPAIAHRDGFPIGLKDVREIIDEPEKLAARLKRVSIERAGQLSDEVLVERLAAEPRVLAIVNTKSHAASLFAGLGARGVSDGLLHLSAAMCPAHRTEVLKEIKRRMVFDGTLPCRVISTSLVEAGVDLDFPIVFRAMAGLDAITQAAGRCNREGRLAVGRVIVFETESRSPAFVRSGAVHTRELVDLYADDLLGLSAIEKFFRLQYWSKKDCWDNARIFLARAREALLANKGLKGGDAPFYILGLSPNASRLAVRFWLAGTVDELAKRLARHARRLEIVRPDDADPVGDLSLRRLVLETARPKNGWPDEDSVSPLLAGAVLRGVLSGGPYPRALLGGVIARIQAEGFAHPDIRTFGAVMTTGVNCGQVRGAVQLSLARSTDPIVSLEHAVTRCAVTTEKESEAQEGGNRTMGRKFTVPYALYRTHVYINPNLAEQTGFSNDDLALFKEALNMMFEHDKSAARANMKPVRCIAFKHESKLGNARADQLFERVTIALKPDLAAASKPARSKHDYEVRVNESDLPAGVTVEYWV